MLRVTGNVDYKGFVDESSNFLIRKVMEIRRLRYSRLLPINATSVRGSTVEWFWEMVGSDM